MSMVVGVEVAMEVVVTGAAMVIEMEVLGLTDIIMVGTVPVRTEAFGSKHFMY
ncbi:hypothetical protein SLEP1_g20049 [Rubroshorea leprosula]|uniref:Uncharacterized protein n=1 Tax=Rubroshorea leprosula TaxID=152421 RepID=A0AAV5J8Z5_9ROSI|nr:hypothetical protein SLEP1_g20049 [Rubroshorea leprosula]